MFVENETLGVDIEVIGAWKEFLQAVSPYIKITGEICVKNIAKTVMLKINSYVNDDNVFTLNDEKIFGYYNEIMTEYAGVTARCNERLPEISNMRIKEILNGVCEILAAQLNQYEEHTGRSPGPVGGAFKNPIAAEKDRVLASVYGNVTDALKAVNQSIFSENGYFGMHELKEFCYYCAGRSANDSHIDFFTFLYQGIIEKGGLDIYKSYSGPLAECARKINSFDERKETQFFYEALKQERENLESIVKIQLAALDEELALDTTPEREKETIEGITSSLTSAFDNLEEKTRELNSIFGEPESSIKKPVMMDYDDFLTFIEERGLCAVIDRLGEEGLESGTLSAVQQWTEKLDRFTRVFEAFAAEYVRIIDDPKQYKMFVYEMRKRITDKLMMTEEMLKAFRELKRFYCLNRGRLAESVPSDYMKIIDGINESFVIKIETLKDAKNSFDEETSEKLSSFAPPDFSQDDETELLALRLSAWGDEMLGIDAYLANYDEEAQSALQGVIKKLERINNTDDYLARTERKIQKETDEITKLETSYLKNSVLFEIVTFEEILAYSVSKLRELDDEACREYVALCEALAETLAKLCKLHNIAVIDPAPYDFFNSAEHEVLVAEKTEGYRKGQIIKKMNSGFKYNELVLMRANVIAAR